MDTPYQQEIWARLSLLIWTKSVALIATSRPAGGHPASCHSGDDIHLNLLYKFRPYSAYCPLQMTEHIPIYGLEKKKSRLMMKLYLIKFGSPMAGNIPSPQVLKMEMLVR